MKRTIILFTLLGIITEIIAQVIDNPVFDRTDEFRFRVEKVDFSKDTTYIYCSYKAEENSWVWISKNVYIENVTNGIKYPIVKVSGIPLEPQKKHFDNEEDLQFVLYFPKFTADKINLIENEKVEAFNIYGIDLKNSYNSSYSPEDIQNNFAAYQKYEEEKDWKSALYYTQKQLEATNYIEGVRSFASACSIYNMIMVYFGLRDYSKMIEWGNKAIDILREMPRDSIYLDVLARAYGTVSSAYYLLNQKDRGLQYEELSLATRRFGNNIGRISYEKYLQTLARKYYYEENYPKAYLYGREVADIYKRKYGENSKYGCLYITSLSNCCEFCQQMGKYEDAIDYGLQAQTLITKGVCQDSIHTKWHKRYVVHNLASAMNRLGRTDEAIGYLEENIKSTDKCDREILSSRELLADILLETKHDTLRALNEYNLLLKIVSDSLAYDRDYYPLYTSLLITLYLYNRDKSPDLALQYLKKYILAQKEWNGEESVAFGNACLHYIYDTYIWHKAFTGENSGMDSLLYYTQKASDIFKRHINNSVYNMSKKERMSYWQRYKSLYTWLIPTLCGMSRGAANSLAYDAALFYKGVLLSAEKEFKDVIRSSQNDTLVHIYDEYIYKISMLEGLLHSSSKIAVDSLNKIIKTQEYNLSQSVTRLNKKYKGTAFSWEDVRKMLHSDEIAIEIASYYSIDGQNVYYDAYIIDGNSSVPKMIALFSENELRNCFVNDSINHVGISKLLWGNKLLANMLKGKKYIYISPSGLLNSIAFEYLPIEDGRFIFDEYNVYRLTSTRELCFKDTTKIFKRACLFGGLDYNSARYLNIANAEKQQNRVSRAVIDSLGQRGGLDPLFGSKKEIEQIKIEMDRANIDCCVYTGVEGTEESFASLSGSQMNIIHLSTHGMYVHCDDFSFDTNKFRFILSDEDKSVDEESSLLSHSFLAMSGVNTTIHNDSLSIGKDDGFLTALEISRFDFTDLDLVVLSACETALGEIDSEGVYGLQRSFKKAGANTIIMSLAKVDDEATKILMVDFYRNLMSGKTKHQSFKDAQKYLRQVENGKYNKPEYWASFIMLDGLN